VKALALICILIVGFLTVQPLLPAPQSGKPDTCCQKEKCSKEDSRSNDNRSCQNKSCNPFIACAYGNFYYLQTGEMVPGKISLNKVETFLYNDNRLASAFSDCWHPPQG
jgi:hypothetical protein